MERETWSLFHEVVESPPGSALPGNFGIVDPGLDPYAYENEILVRGEVVTRRLNSKYKWSYGKPSFVI